MADEREQDSAGKAQHISITLAVETNVAGSIGIGTTNTAAARKRQLQNAIADVDAAVRARTLGQIQNDVKRALEAIHELKDCLCRGEWSNASWDARVRGLWHAHLGARNAAHHESSSIVSLPGQPGQPLVWAIPATAFKGKRQKSEYYARLDGQPVLPLLREMTSRISSAIP